MFRRRIAAAIATVTLGLAGAVAAPVVAHADDYCDYEDETFPTIYSVSPRTVVVGTQSKLVTFSVSADDDCGVQNWDIYGPHVWAWQKSPTERISPWSNTDAGASYVDVEVNDTNYNTTTERFSFTLKRATYVSGFNVTPEPVKKGKYVTVKGTLKRADWDQDKYVSYGAKSQKVKIQFRAKGTSTYKTIKTVTLGKRSDVASKIKVAGSLAKDGYYRLSYAGNGTTGASSPPATTSTSGSRRRRGLTARSLRPARRSPRRCARERRRRSGRAAPWWRSPRGPRPARWP